MSLVNPSIDCVIGEDAYKLQFNMLALDCLKKQSGKSLHDMIRLLQQDGGLDYSDMLALIWAGSQCHDPVALKRGRNVAFEDFAAKYTPAELSDSALHEAVFQAIHAAMPKPKESDEPNETEANDATE